MRIAPIGTLFSKDQKVELVNYVKEISEATHTSDVAIAGASMIAYAVTLAAEDKNWKEIIEGVLDIHDIAIKEGEQTFSASIAERLKLAVQFANHFESEEEYSLWLYNVIGCGTSLTESVPTALAIAYFCKDPNKCAIFCANIGGDTDTIGAMATAISGAKYGYSNFKKLWIETIDKHNSVNLEQYATTLEKIKCYKNRGVRYGKRRNLSSWKWKNGKPIDLFFIWFAANLGILGIVYGAVIVSYGLSFLQSILIAIIGPLSFVLVGYISVAGRDSGAITFMLSRAPFGFKGNHIPALIGWVGQVGWLSVNVSTGTLTLLALFNTFGFKTSTFLILMSLAIFAGLVIISVLFHKKYLYQYKHFSHMYLVH